MTELAQQVRHSLWKCIQEKILTFACVSLKISSTSRQIFYRFSPVLPTLLLIHVLISLRLDCHKFKAEVVFHVHHTHLSVIP